MIFHFIFNRSIFYQNLYIKCYFIQLGSLFFIDDAATYICIIFILKFNVYNGIHNHIYCIYYITLDNSILKFSDLLQQCF